MNNSIVFAGMIVGLFLLIGCGNSGEGPCQCQPSDIDDRIKMAKNRLLHGEKPSYNRDFVLADVSLLPRHKRIFTEFSGDISGRYISAISQLPLAEHPAGFKKLVKKAISYQHEDGRFGDKNLEFTVQSIDKPHMPLLWGNGRILVGLLDYYLAYKDQEALDAAVRLGDFICSVISHCSDPDLAVKLRGLGIHGYMCFTQTVEGLVMLGDVSGNRKYLEAAESVYKMLQPRGTQHTHGYLTALRGVMMLYDKTKDSRHLEFARKHFDSLLECNDYTIYGGVPEYFKQMSNLDKYILDEGCSEADFTVLAFQLWKATGDIKYLEIAERCLLNQFLHNQFPSGDFGYQALDGISGFKAPQYVRKAFYCCNMHGLRHLLESKKYIVTRTGNTIRLNLFINSKWSDEDISFVFNKDVNDGMLYHLHVRKTKGEKLTLSIRNPGWAEHMTLELNGKALQHAQGQYIDLSRKWKPGDKLSIRFKYKTSLVSQNGTPFSEDQLKQQDLKAYLFHGPWLMGVAKSTNPGFFSGTCKKVIHLDKKSEKPETLRDSRIEEAYLFLHYSKDAEGLLPVVLLPISEMAFENDRSIRVLLDFSGRKD